jgi:predicted transcriptional regulator
MDQMEKEIMKMKKDLHYKVMSITTDDASKERLEILALRMGTTMSGLIRQLVWNEFQKQEKQKAIA